MEGVNFSYEQAASRAKDQKGLFISSAPLKEWGRGNDGGPIFSLSKSNQDQVIMQISGSMMI
jgi:hypothetical protein